MNTKRILKDLESVSQSIEKYSPEHNYYYHCNESNLTEGIVLILGVQDSPYFGGFYFFKNKFQDNYPFEPPKWNFLSNDGKTRFNPNLYQTSFQGKVCLSILNTWAESTWSQVQRFSSVIETVRAHLFIENPLTNEPGYSKSHPSCPIYTRMIYYQNLNFNVYNNIIQTPDYAKPFKKLMVENFMINKNYFKDYINKNKHLHGTTEEISYDRQCVTYNFVNLEKKYNELVAYCENYLK